MLKYCLWPLLSLLLLMPGVVGGQQSEAKGEWGGLTDILDFPVGARAMAMGGAYVTVADDPFALYWNPAGLEKIPQK